MQNIENALAKQVTPYLIFLATWPITILEFILIGIPFYISQGIFLVSGYTALRLASSWSQMEEGISISFTQEDIPTQTILFILPLIFSIIFNVYKVITKKDIDANWLHKSVALGILNITITLISLFILYRLNELSTNIAITALILTLSALAMTNIHFFLKEKIRAWGENKLRLRNKKYSL